MQTHCFKYILVSLLLYISQVVELQANTPPHSEDWINWDFAGSTPPDLLLSIRQQFEIDSDKIVATPELKTLSQKVDSVLRVDSVTYVKIKGYASIDGPRDFNIRLARARAMAMSNWLRETTPIDPTIIHISSNGEDWNMFDSLVRIDPRMPFKSEVEGIIRSDATEMQKQKELRVLNNGEVWKYMVKHTFPEMRIADISLGGFYNFKVHLDKVPQIETKEIAEEEEETIMVYDSPQPSINSHEIAQERWVRRLYLKSNAPAWIMLWVNAAIEIDIAPHWSFSIPVYWSGFNYGKQTLKFRTLSTVPEFRYWLRSDNMGFYVNTHFGVGTYNYAKDKEYRYQNHNGKTPAVGGGIGLGYRFYFCRNHHWSMEAALGFGIYKLDYDIFQNSPHTDYGYLLGRRKRTFYGIDQAALSFCYSFGLINKGGDK